MAILYIFIIITYMNKYHNIIKLIIQFNCNTNVYTCIREHVYSDSCSSHTNIAKEVEWIDMKDIVKIFRSS